MKITLSQPVLSNAIAKGGVAAFTAEGQSEEQKSSNVTKSCMSIRADADSVTFESTVSKMAARYVVKAGEGVKIDDPGEVCVPARELKDICSKLREDQSVRLEFVPSAPKQAEASPYGIQSDGNIDLRVFDGDNEVIQASIESYPTARFEKATFKTDPVVLKCKNKLVKEAAAMVAFATNPTDYAELLNNIGIFAGENVMFFVGTDRKRCAISSVDRKSFEAVGIDSVLLESENLAKAMEIFEADDDVSFAMEPDATHITLYSGSVSILLNTVDKIRKAKFPDYRKVLKMGTKVKIVIDRKALEFGLKAISLANRQKSLYVVKQGAESIVMKAKGVTAVRAIEAKAKCEKISESLTAEAVSFSTEAFAGCIDKLSGEKVNLSFTADEMRAKVDSPDSPNFVYLLQRSPDDEM
jgi:DNA polymerase III sliding clamp (beta) subunit (PCNA family)